MGPAPGRSGTWHGCRCTTASAARAARAAGKSEEVVVRQDFHLQVVVLREIAEEVVGQRLDVVDLAIHQHRLVAAQALSLMVDTEDFLTHKSEYYANEDVEALLQLKENVLQDLMSDLDARKLVRPLVDAIDKAKRLMRK